MQGARRTVRGRRETLPCLLTFTSGSTGDESGQSRRHTGERAGLFKLRRCMMVVAASCGRRFVTGDRRRSRAKCVRDALQSLEVTECELTLHTPDHVYSSLNSLYALSSWPSRNIVSNLVKRTKAHSSTSGFQASAQTSTILYPRCCM
jgi:hypothetical protein